MSNNGNFTSTINDIGVHELYQLYNKLRKEDLDIYDKMETVEAVTSHGEFMDEYFNNVFDPVINNGDELATDGNVCVLLERLGDYLIRSDESKAMDEEDYITIHTREQLTSKINREHDYTDDSVDINDLKSTDSPSKSNIILKEMEDLENIKTDNETLKEYILLLRDLRKKYKEKDANKLKLSNDMSRVREDIRYIMSKDEIESSGLASDSYYNNSIDIDFGNVSQIEAIMFNHIELEENEDLWLAQESVMDCLKGMNLYLELGVVSALIQQHYNKKEIKNYMNISNDKLNSYINELILYVSMKLA